MGFCLCRWDVCCWLILILCIGLSVGMLSVFVVLCVISVLW